MRSVIPESWQGCGRAVVLGLALTLPMASAWSQNAAPTKADPSFLPPEELQARLEDFMGGAQHLDVPPAAAAAASGYADIDGARLHGFLADLTEFSEQSRAAGDVMWGRIMGSEYERRAAEYVAQRFAELGLADVERTPIPLPPQWRPTRVELQVLDPAGGAAQSRVLASAMAGFGAPSTPEGGIEAPLEYVGLGTPADLAGRDLAGKIALVHGRTKGGVHLHTGSAAVSRLVRDGRALGVIVIVDQPGNGKTVSRNGNDGPRIPNMTLGWIDGTYLRKRIEHAPPGEPVRVRMTIRAQRVPGLNTWAVHGRLPGRTDEVVIVQAHLDGFWSAVTDNGGGVAGVLGLARHYAARAPEQRRRGLVFLVTGGHEDGSLGVGGFARANPELLERTVFVMELEHVASSQVSDTISGHYQRTNSEAPVGPFVTNSSPLILRAFREAAQRHQVVVNQEHNPFYWGDIIGFMPSGVTCGGWIGSSFFYHSTLDSLEAVRPQALERVVRATAQVLDAIDGHTRAELEAGAVPFEIPPGYDGQGHGLPSPMRTLLEFTQSLW